MFCNDDEKVIERPELSSIYPGTTEIVFQQMNGFEDQVIYNKTIPRDALYHFIKEMLYSLLPNR